ncbi:uncharacterized protein LOC131423068 [Diceros bicornis minor]|uniref:uncharacterized protein LOC131423068 n=1 Tax=Diceros bicornis minor TaxID=77932 RepID=UPI0026E969AE|nr:uncharacterized protein LOC131423068 [Diceros bicornis minor]
MAAPQAPPRRREGERGDAARAHPAGEQPRSTNRCRGAGTRGSGARGPGGRHSLPEVAVARSNKATRRLRSGPLGVSTRGWGRCGARRAGSALPVAGAAGPRPHSSRAPLIQARTCRAGFAAVRSRKWLLSGRPQTDAAAEGSAEGPATGLGPETPPGERGRAGGRMLGRERRGWARTGPEHFLSSPLLVSSAFRPPAVSTSGNASRCFRSGKVWEAGSDC